MNITKYCAIATMSASITSCVPNITQTPDQVSNTVMVSESKYTGKKSFLGPRMQNTNPVAAGLGSMPYVTYNLAAVEDGKSLRYALRGEIYGSRDVGWTFPERCYLAGHGEIPLEQGSSNVSTAGGGVGVTEEFFVEFNRSLLDKSQAQGLDLLVTGSRRNIPLNVPSHQLSGFLQRVDKE